MVSRLFGQVSFVRLKRNLFAFVKVLNQTAIKTVSIRLCYNRCICEKCVYICIKSVVFYAETEQGVAQAIIRSVVDFRRDPWPKVSDNAKDLVKKMLDPDPKRRLTAQEVLGNV